MKEILINSVTDIGYKIFKDGILTSATGPVEVTVYRGSKKVVDSATASSAVAGYTYTLPVTATVDSTEVAVTAEEGILEVIWSFNLLGNQMSSVQYYKVVTPYVDWEYFYESAIAYADYLESERVARYIINTHCGQQFGKENTIYAIEGHGENSLTLPRHLITLDTVTWLDQHDSTNVIGADYTWEITADGWVLRRQPYPYQYDITINTRQSFRRNVTYNVAGVWGYDGIPTEVEEAAKILAADFLCEQHKYRDKYLKSIKIDNWRLEFTDQAFIGTGNATADKLLIDYKLEPGIGLI